MPLTPDQARDMIDGAQPWFRAAIVIGAGLGLRQSEAAGLTLDRVDFLRRTVRVDRQWQQASGTRAGAFNPPKTAAGVRVIPASPWVLDELASHITRFGVGASSVIVQRDGGPLDAARWGHYVRNARRAAALPPTISFHDLRHFFASALIAAGCSIKQVQAALGHESAKVTLDVYGHLWPGDEDRVRDAVQRLSFNAPGGSLGSSSAV